MSRSVARVAFAFSLLLFSPSLFAAEPATLPGKPGDWNGYPRYELTVDGKQASVVAPKKAAPGRPWVWHGEFFGHKPAPDIALLGLGFHIVYMKVPDMLGSPGAVAHWNALYQELTEKYGFAKKAALVGLSRGGLYCYNWAEANPDKVACIYGDAPVCDFKSWPGGKGKGKGSTRDWKLVLERYRFADDTAALAYQKNPVDNLKPLADAHVPLLHVYGDADDVVPWEENTGLLADRYRKLGGSITLIAKPGVGHHPHGLDDCTPIVRFIAEHSSVALSGPIYVPVTAELVRPRRGLGNVLAKLRDGQKVKIGYLGGSITAAPGWRVKSREWFSHEFPQAKVEEINAAIGGTGSNLGVFRLDRDVLRHEPDLLFVEFAVNDGGAAPARIWQAMEGIVRQTWAKNPRTDICFVYTFRIGYEKDLLQGLCPQAASAMELLAAHYDLPSINVALKTVELAKAGKLIYQSAEPTSAGVVRFSTDGVHPLDEGHQIYTDVIAAAVRQIADSKPVDHGPALAATFVADHWQAAKMVPILQPMLSGSWQQLSPGDPLQKQFGERMGALWEASKPGSRVSFKFRGSVVMLYDLLAPDGGQVVITVDGVKRPKPVPRFDYHCTYSRIGTLAIAEGLEPDQVHTVSVEIHPDQPDRTPVAFRLKDPAKELKSAKYQGTFLRTSQIMVVGEVLP